MDSPEVGEVDNDQNVHIYDRFISLGTVGDLRGRLNIENTHMSRSGGLRREHLPGMFFGHRLACTEEVAVDRAKLTGYQAEFLPFGMDAGMDVSQYRENAAGYLEHAPYAAHLIIAVTEENFDLLRGRIFPVERKGEFGRSVLPSAEKFSDLKHVGVVINLNGITPEELGNFGECVKVAIYSRDDSRPDYITFADYLNKPTGS